MDTNIIIKYLKGEELVNINLEKSLFIGDEILIPQIVNYEILRGYAIYPAPKKQNFYELLLESCRIVYFTESTWRIAIELYSNMYKNHFTVGEFDLLIAALAIENDSVLVTNNTKDFEKFQSITLLDWSKQ